MESKQATNTRTIERMSLQLQQTAAAADALLNEISSKRRAGLDSREDQESYERICNKAKALNSEIFQLQRDNFITETRHS